jgi:predicted Zn-dependent protease
MKSKAHGTTLGVVGLVVLALLACKKKEQPSTQADPQPVPTVEAPTPTPHWFTHKASGTQFLAPVGWNERTSRDAVAFFAPDKTAVIAVGSYDKNKDPSATIMATARELGLTDLDWHGGTKQSSLNGIPARTAEGTCKSNGQPAEYGYATLTPGGPQNLLLIYAVLKSAPQDRRQEAIQSFRSFRRS